MPPLPLLDTRSPRFPPVSQALADPEGLLAAGGNLEPDTLVRAYYSGIFPWFSEGQPILWWSPDPRCVIEPDAFHVSRSLARTLRRHPWRFTVNQAFAGVIQRCATSRAAARPAAADTWITPEMIQAYTQLHHAGAAHSIEVWLNGELAGGLYGVRIGALFCGESMFSLVTDASKLALHHLCRLAGSAGIRLIDCQLPTPHLLSLGAQILPRSEFLRALKAYRDAPSAPLA